MQILINGLIAGSLAALIAGGLALVYGVMGVFNLALGQMVLVGGYSTWWLHQVVGLPLFLSIPGGLIIGGLVSWFAYDVFVKPYYRIHRFLPLVTTIAFSMILDGVIIIAFGEKSQKILPGLKKTFDVLGGRISNEQIILIGSTVALIIAFAYVLHSTVFGRKLRAVVQNDYAAMSLGIHARFMHRLLFIFSGLLAACAGIFIGVDQVLSPILAFPLTIKAYAAVIAGGKGNVWGAILCAYIIAFLEQIVVGVSWFGFYVPAGYQQSVALVVIILFLLVKPDGIFSSRSRSA